MTVIQDVIRAVLSDNIGSVFGEAVAVSPNLIPDNGEFNTDLTGFSQTGASWVWSAADGGSASLDRFIGGGADLLLDVIDISELDPGETYEVGLDITARTAGTVKIRINGDANVDSASWGAVGSYTDEMICPTNPTKLRLSGSAVAVLSVDNWFVKKK